MKSTRSNWRKLSKSSLRFNFILLSSFLLTIFFFGASYWAIYKVLSTQRIQANYSYFRLIGAIHDYELFLLQVVRSTPAPYPLDIGAMTSTITEDEPHHLTFYDVAGGAHAPAFSLVLPRSASEDAGRQATSQKLKFGMTLSNFHHGFWSDSSYPAPQMFLLDLDSKLGMAIPAIECCAGSGEMARNNLLSVIGRVSRVLQHNPPDPNAHRVDWRPSEAFLGRHSQEVLAYVSDKVPDQSWETNRESPRIVVATLFDLDSIFGYSSSRHAPFFDSLDLISPAGVVLLGSGSSNSEYEDGIYLTWKGVLIKRSSGIENSWHAIYHVGYQRLFQGAKWPLFNVALLLVVCLALGWLLLWWQRRNISQPTDQYYGSLVSRDEFSQSIIQATPVALCVIRESGRQLVMQNSLALQWLGEPDVLDQLMCDWHMFEEGNPVNGEACAIIGSLYLHARFAPTTYQGEPASLCAFIDITAHKEAESELRSSRNNANAANEQKSRFLAVMSHEIRTPLYGVVGTLELLGLTRLNQQQQGYLRTIKGSSSILLQLISDILDVSKIDAGQMSLDAAHFAPLDVVEEAVRTYSAMADGKGLLLYSCVDTDLPGQVLGDGVRVRQIINNLLSNAIKFTKSGSVVLYLKVVDREEGRVRLRWQIADTGVGISNEQLPDLFEPFYQASNQHHALSGTGLGLSICSLLSQMMQGILEVTSTLGMGSVFSFEVELLEVECSVQLPEASQISRVKIHVRSPVVELTSDICQWLEMSLGNIVAWDEQAHEIPDSAAVLLELLPESLPAVDWEGPRIVASNDASVQPLLSDHRWHVNVHCRVSVIHAVMLALGWPVKSTMPLNSVRPERTLSLRVLLAEDHPVNQALLTEQLEQLGCSVTLAGNGLEALKCLEQSEFDVVLTDLNMPVMDGYEFVERLRLSNCVIPIVAVSANALKEEVERCIAAGMNAWLTKPITLHALYDGLMKVINEKAVRMIRLEPPKKSAPPGDVEDFFALPEQIRILFINTMTEDLDAIYVAMQRNDIDEIIRLLHRIRGALSTAGIPDLVVAIREVEIALIQGGILSLAPCLRPLLERLQALLNQFRIITS